MTSGTARREDDPNARPTLDEQYSTAVGASNLRVEADKHGAADHIIAAGLNVAQLGIALKRLRHEWDASAKPIPLTPARLEELAGSYQRLETGLVRITEKVNDGTCVQEVMRDVKPMFAAQLDADRWMTNELRLLMMSLRSLSEVRAAIGAWVDKFNLEDGQHAVGAALLWWLEPRCPHCQGAGKTVDYKGTSRKSTKPCRPCEGSGQRRVPHGPIGRRLVSFIWSQLGDATKDRRERM